MSAGCSNDPGQQTMILLISGIPTAVGGIRGSRPSHEGMEDMIRVPSAHRLSWIGIESTGKKVKTVKKGERVLFPKIRAFHHPEWSLSEQTKKAWHINRWNIAYNSTQQLTRWYLPNVALFILFFNPHYCYAVVYLTFLKVYNSEAVMDRICLWLLLNNVTSCAETDSSPDHLGDGILGSAHLEAALNPVQNPTERAVLLFWSAAWTQKHVLEALLSSPSDWHLSSFTAWMKSNDWKILLILEVKTVMTTKLS